MNEIEHIPKCPKNGEVNLLYLIKSNMEFLEKKDLEDIIWEAYQSEYGKYELFNKGLSISGKMYRQVNLGDYGILDLMTVSINPEDVIISIIICL